MYTVSHYLHSLLPCLPLLTHLFQVTIKMSPAKPNDMNDTQVGKVNFATHLVWLTQMWLISWSLLLYCDRLFKEVIDEGRIRWERLVLRCLYTLVFLWFLSSVIHYSFATWVSINGRQAFWTVFPNGLNFDRYWRFGPSTTYIARIWYTNLVHIILDVMILALPAIWIRRARFRWSRKLTLIYLLLFLSGFLWVMMIWLCYLFTPSFLLLEEGFLLRNSQAWYLHLILNRTTGVSIFRLIELDKRFGASAEDRYQLAIIAVACSFFEANLTIICANLPTLGYKVFFDWVQDYKYGEVNAEGLRQLTIGNGPNPSRVGGGDIEFGDIAEHHRRYQDRAIDD